MFMRVGKLNLSQVRDAKLNWPAWFLIWFLVPLFSPAAAPLTIANVYVVNITPSSFSVVCAASPGITTLSVFADPAGVTNLAGQVGLEFYPTHSGDPSLTDSYARRLSQTILRQKTISQGLVH